MFAVVCVLNSLYRHHFASTSPLRSILSPRNVPRNNLLCRGPSHHFSFPGVTMNFLPSLPHRVRDLTVSDAEPTSRPTLRERAGDEVLTSDWSRSNSSLLDSRALRWPKDVVPGRQCYIAHRKLGYWKSPSRSLASPLRDIVDFDYYTFSWEVRIVLSKPFSSTLDH